MMPLILPLYAWCMRWLALFLVHIMLTVGCDAHTKTELRSKEMSTIFSSEECFTHIQVWVSWS